MHIGSQVTSLEPYVYSYRLMARLIDDLLRGVRHRAMPISAAGSRVRLSGHRRCAAASD